MIGNSTASTRLCPSCANSIAEDAGDCPYCKADLSAQFAPRWLRRDESSSKPEHERKFSIPGKFIWMGAVFVAALIGFFAGRYLQSSELSLAAQNHLKQLQSKDQMIQSQEAQLAQTRQQLKESSDQLAESEKALSLAQQRLSVATREVSRLNANRAPAVGRTASRAPAAPVPERTARPTAAPGVYETIRATSVYEDPSSNSRVISQISGGTRINVVSSARGWLEVRSRRGNPPGYVRSEDARPIGGTS